MANRAIALAPTNVIVVETKVLVYLSQGDLAGAQRVLRAVPRDLEPAALVAYFSVYEDLYWILDDEQQRLVLRLTPRQFDNNRAPWAMALTEVHALRGDQARARAYADTARISLEEALSATPEDAQLHALHGVALAYLGRKDEAIREGQRAVELSPVSRDALSGPYFLLQLGRIYLLVGEPEQAIDQLERLLAVPYHVSPAWLTIDPTFDPVRSHPRFQKLAATPDS